MSRARGRRVTPRREPSKPGEPRVLPLGEELVTIIETQWKAREYRTPTGDSTLPGDVCPRREHPARRPP